jgi:hypothetical protein
MSVPTFQNGIIEAYVWELKAIMVPLDGNGSPTNIQRCAFLLEKCSQNGRMSFGGSWSDTSVKLVVKSVCRGRHVVEPVLVHSKIWAEEDVWLEAGSICIDNLEKSDF